MKCIIIILQFITAVNISGCVCTNYVQNIGKTEASLMDQNAYVDDRGTVYIQTELFRGTMNDSDHEISLGTRYLVLNSPGFQKSIEESISQERYRRKDDLRLQIHAGDYLYPSDTSDMATLTGWYLYPPDILNKLTNVELPEYLRSTEWVRYPLKPMTYIPGTVNGRDYHVEIAIDSRLKNNSDAIFQETWAIPLKLLIVPAVVIDIVTFPFQYIWATSHIKG